MKEKKTAVITFRCTEQIKQKLEIEAESKKWSTSQLIERIILDHVLDEEERQEMLHGQASEIYDYLTETKCTNMAQLIAWAIKNNCLDAVVDAKDVWEALIKEIKTDA